MHRGQADIGRRIVVVGSSGSGKSTLAAALATSLDVPHVELDALHWEPGWQGVPIEELRARVAAATAGDGWVVDGNYSGSWSASWPRAETLVWLDLPLPLVLWRIGVRSWRRSSRHELLWGTNEERFWPQFQLWEREESLFTWTVTHRGVLRRRLEIAMEHPKCAHLRFVRLRSRREVADFLEAIETRAAPSAPPIGGVPPTGPQGRCP